MPTKIKEGQWADFQGADERRLAQQQQSIIEWQYFLQPHQGESLPFLPVE